MQLIRPSHHGVFRSVVSLVVLSALLAACELFGDRRDGGLMASDVALTVSAGAPVTRFDFEEEDLTDWKSLSGQWAIEEMPDAPSGKWVLVQRAVQNDFNVILASGPAYTNVDISVQFKPLSGGEDASGGIVFRFAEQRYYLIRANALENNLRLYYYDGKRYQLASASTQPPRLGHWHTIRVVAVGDRIQGWLDGRLLIDHRDKRLKWGDVGLWTKADSITAFDNLTIQGYWSARSF